MARHKDALHVPFLVMFVHGSQKALQAKKTKAGGRGIKKRQSVLFATQPEVKVLEAKTKDVTELRAALIPTEASLTGPSAHRWLMTLTGKRTPKTECKSSEIFSKKTRQPS
jgi:hypothetical protein